MSRRSLALVVLLLAAARPAVAQQADSKFPLFRYLTGSPPARLITFSPSELDPRQDANQRRLKTSSIRADLEALRPAFDGLILYGYHEGCTPRILAEARRLKYRAVVLAVYDPKSAAEADGVAELCRLFEKDFALGVLIGNEGVTFQRYEREDLTNAAGRLRAKVPATVPLGTSEPLHGSQDAFILSFGDFVAANIHPAFDRPDFTPAEAAAWVRSEAAALAAQASKPVLVKETGIPHAGKPAYTPAAQAAFWSAYVKPGLVARGADDPKAWVFHGVAFEAFDLPWKSEESRLDMEKSWGLLSTKRQPYPAFTVWRGAGK